MISGKLLIVDDDKVALKNLEQVMKKAGHAVVATQSGGNALALPEKQPFNVVLTELRMDKADGMQLLKRCRDNHPDTEVILLTGHATLASAVEAMKQGAYYYLAKPWRGEELEERVAGALEKIRTGLVDKSFGRMTAGRFEVSTLLDETNLFPGVNVIGG